MKMESRKIYSKKNKDGTYSYKLVLSTTKAGMMFMYLAPKNASAYYENIDGIYFDQLDAYAAFDRVMYIGWSKYYDANYTEVYTVPYRRFSAITTAIKQFIDGAIVQNDKGHYYYYDELEKKVSKKDDTSTTKIDVSVNVSTNSDTITTGASIEVKSINQNITEFNNPDLVEKAKEFGIPTSDEKDAPKSVKYVNLLENDKSDSGVYSKSSGKATTKKKKNSSDNACPRSMYTEDEALAISNMPVKAIASKYKVSYSVALIMRRNARNIFGFEVKKRDNDSNLYAKMFEEGYTLDQVIKAYPDVPTTRIKKSYDIYSISKYDDTEVVEYFDKVIKDNNLTEMLSVVWMSGLKFGQKYKCPHSSAIKIINKIRGILCLNPLFTAGLEEIAFDPNIEEIISSKRSSTSEKDIITVRNYDTCMRLYNAYTTSYNIHGDILAGTQPIPSSVSESDRDYFLNLINNRFNYTIINPDRVLTTHQKDLLMNARTVEIACEFMINYKKAYNLANNYRYNMKRRGGGN